MACDLLAIPATSTPSERLFSCAGEIYSSRRKCLHGDTAQALLNLGTWWGGQGLPGLEAPIIRYPKKPDVYLPVVVERGENWEFEGAEGKVVSVEACDEALDATGDDDEVPNLAGFWMQ
jgi:hypothetical protein